MRLSWKQTVPPASRPTSPAHGRNWENFFGVVLRDPGKVAFFDGDTREELARIDTGFAAHILRSSSSGRYFYAVGRDGRVTLIDLWSSPPSAVAQVTYDTQEPLNEVRVAAIVASPFDPLWVLSLEESGYVGLVDYNWLDPVYGWVNATTHLGEGRLAVYGADPEGHPEHAWKVVRQVTLPSAGGLFLETHEQSPWVLMASTTGRVVHFEFDRTGSEVWVSVWDTNGEIVIYDATTLAQKHRITGLPTPTGKSNVYNTAHDVY